MALATPTTTDPSMTSSTQEVAGVPSSKADLDTALKAISQSTAKYTLYDNYQTGRHHLAFATEKFSNAFGALFREFADNQCGSVIDALADRLQVTGFDVEEGPTSAGDDAWQIWQTNRIDQRAGEVHQGAISLGDSYIIVWPGKDGQARIYVNDARNMYVKYDEEDPGTILWAAKAWVTDKKQKRVTLYYPDRLEKYVYLSTNTVTMPSNGRNFIPYNAPGEAWPLPNPYDVVPVFHFANNAPIGAVGTSELHPVIPLQDALNKSVMDMLVAMEFVAFPQRYMTGVEVNVDQVTGKPIAPFQPGVDRLWAAEGENVKFGEFQAADLGNFLKVSDNFRVEIARISGTPLHYMGLPDSSGRALSGEALKVLESRFTKKVRDRQENWGNIWENVMALALLIAGQGEKGLRLSAKWVDASSSSENEKIANADIMLNKIGLDEEYVWPLVGVPEAEITRILDARKATQLLITASTMLPASTAINQAENGGVVQPVPTVPVPSPAQNGKHPAMATNGAKP